MKRLMLGAMAVLVATVGLAGCTIEDTDSGEKTRNSGDEGGSGSGDEGGSGTADEGGSGTADEGGANAGGSGAVTAAGANAGGAGPTAGAAPTAGATGEAGAATAGAGPQGGAAPTAGAAGAEPTAGAAPVAGAGGAAPTAGAAPMAGAGGADVVIVGSAAGAGGAGEEETGTGDTEVGDVCDDTVQCKPGSLCFEGICVQTGNIRVSLSWTPVVDLDLHVLTPAGNEIYYAAREFDGGYLDVDDCVGLRCTDDLGTHVENVFFDLPPHGEYQVWVHNYSAPDSSPVPYTLTVVANGDVLWTGDGAVIEYEDSPVYVFEY
jgi:hypothetical protein